MRTFKIILISAYLAAFALPAALAQEVLTWSDCLAEAKKNHPDLISAQETVNQSQAAKQITASTLFPQVNSDLSANRAKASGKTANTYSYGVDGTQLLFDGFKTMNNVKGALENIEASRQGYRFTSSQIRYRLRNAFIDLMRAQELITVTEDIVKIRRDELILITLSYESGLEHKGALLTAQANLAQAQFERAQAQRNLEVVQRQLTKEMGRTRLVPLYVKGELVINFANLEKPDFEALAKNNPSLQKLIFQENAAAFGVKSAYGNFSPKISASSGAGEAGSTWPPEKDQWNAGLALSLPLFEGGLRTAQVDQAKALYRQAQANTRSSSDGVVLALEQTWATFADAVERVKVQQKVLEAAQERSKIAEAQYSVGFISYDNWAIIEDNHVQAKKSYLDAQANALLAEAAWVQAKGETLEYVQ